MGVSQYVWGMGCCGNQFSEKDAEAFNAYLKEVGQGHLGLFVDTNVEKNRKEALKALRRETKKKK